MTKKFILSIFVVLVSTLMYGQSTTSATFSGGDIPTDFNAVPTNSTLTICPDTLTINITPGDNVTSIDLNYDMVAFNGGWMADQRSYLRCISTSVSEANVTIGLGNTSDTLSYNRSINVANGISPTGELKFVLYAFRNWGGAGLNCNSNWQYVLNNSWTIDVHHGPPPTCPSPSALTSPSQSGNSITLNWTTGGATNWNIEYGAAGFAQGSGTLVNSSTNPYVLTGLSPSTAYDVYLKDSCGLGDVSNWIGPLTVSTNCGVSPTPFTENFDNANWVAGVGLANTGNQIDQCWIRNTLPGAFHWGTQIFNTPSGGTGPIQDNTTGGGSYVYTEASSIGGPATLESPDIDLSNLNNPELRFWYHMFGNAIGSISVDIYDGNSWTNGVFNLNGLQQTLQIDPWQEAVVNLNAYANDTIKVRFSATRGANFSGDMAIDDFQIIEQPSCPTPTGLTASNATTTSIDLAWTSGGATNWNIEYGPPGFALGTGTMISTSSNPHTVTALSAQTTYDFYLQDSCGPGDLSVWIGPVTFRTLCNAGVTLPYSEDFLVDLGCFTAIDGGASVDTWQWINNLNGNTLDGTPFAIVNSDAAGAAAGLLYELLESPTIDASGVTGSLFLEFDQFFNSIGADSANVDVWDGTQWVEVLSQSNANIGTFANPDHQLIDISSYANANLKVRFKYTDNAGWAWWWAIDNFLIHEVLCPQPTNLAGVGLSSSSISLSWTSGGATGWNIEYGPTGFTPGTGTLVNTTTNPINITGLSPQTDYDFYVQDSCGTANLSFWTGPITVRTACAVAATPFTEDFEAAAWVLNFGIGQIDQCWDRTPLPINGFYWQPGPLPFPVPGSGPAGDHTSGTGKYMFTRTSGFPVPPLPSTVEFTSPPIDLSSLTAPELRFWYHMFGNTIGTQGELEVDIFDGSTWTNAIFSLTGEQQTAQADPWLEAVINLNAFVNDTITIRFKATKHVFGFNHMVSIDDITIDEQPSCPQPSLLTATNILSNSVNLSWTSGGASNWIIEYGTPGFTPGNGTSIAVNTNPYTVTGLNSSTTYDFYVRDSCGPGDLSVWIGPLTISTLCNIVASPYTETFDVLPWVTGVGFGNDNNIIDDCWSRNSFPNTGTFHWGTRTGGTPSVNTGPNQDNTSGTGNYLYTEASNGGAPATIESPSIDLSTLTNPKMSFAYHMFGINMGTLEVDIYDGTNWNNAVFSLSGIQQTVQTDPWIVDTVDLSAYLNDTIIIRFTATRGVGFMSDMAIDDLKVFDHIICGVPSNLQALNIKPDSADLDFTSTNNISNLAWGSPGFTPGAGGTYVPFLSSSPYAIGGLSPNTSYEFYVRDSCAPTTIGNWVGPFLFTTPCDTAVAAFSTSRNYLDIEFNGTASQATVGWEWNFDDGSPIGTDSIVNHAYATDGIYNVKLIVTNACNERDSLTIPTAACDTLKAEIAQSVVDTIFTFDGSGSSAGAVNYFWFFGDGNADTGQLVTHSYAASGNYDVSLVVENICGDRDSVSVVASACKDPKAYWTRTVVSTNQNGMTVDFVGINSVDAVNYSWDFGDGNTSNIPNPTHTYIVPSLLYNVCLTVENICTDQNTSCRRLNEIGISEFEVLNQQLRVFPNPSDDVVNIEIPSTNEDFQVELVNVNGSVLYRSTASVDGGNFNHKLNVSELPSGIYLLNLKSKLGTLKRKLIVK